MDHPLIERPILDEMSFVASQHLDSVRSKFQLHDFSHIGEELLEMGKQHSGALSKHLLKPANIAELFELTTCMMLYQWRSAKRRRDGGNEV
jgi:hypothetical protein